MPSSPPASSEESSSEESPDLGSDQDGAFFPVDEEESSEDPSADSGDAIDPFLDDEEHEQDQSPLLPIPIDAELSPVTSLGSSSLGLRFEEDLKMSSSPVLPPASSDLGEESPVLEALSSPLPRKGAKNGRPMKVRVWTAFGHVKLPFAHKGRQLQEIINFSSIQKTGGKDPWAKKLREGDWCLCESSKSKLILKIIKIFKITHLPNPKSPYTLKGVPTQSRYWVLVRTNYVEDDMNRLELVVASKIKPLLVTQTPPADSFQVILYF